MTIKYNCVYFSNYDFFLTKAQQNWDLAASNSPFPWSYIIALSFVGRFSESSREFKLGIELNSLGMVGKRANHNKYFCNLNNQAWQDLDKKDPQREKF